MLPKVGTKLRSVVRRYTVPSLLSTWNRVMSYEPSTKFDEVGYW